MRKLILTALLAAVALPAAAQAQYGELRRDRRDIREQRQDVRDARRDYREDLGDRNRAWRRDDWRGWRDRNHALYARGDWRAPFRYNAFRPGFRISSGFFAPRYIIADPWRYRLPPARGYQRWVRHYDDVLLVDVRRGVVVDVIRGFYR